MAERRDKIILGLDAGPYIRGLATATTATKAFVKELDSSGSRMTNLVQTSLALGPALVPIGAAAVPAIAGLTAGLAAAAGAAAVAALAFNGVGDGLTALNAYQLEPSAKNLEAVREEFEKLGPAGTNFVMFLDDLQPKLDKMQNTARGGLLPGVEEGITSLMERGPEVNRIIGEISGALGDLAAEGGANLAGPKFRDFFDYIENEARPILMDMGRTLGNVVEGISNMIIQFDPLADSFSNGLLGISRDFAKWTRSLDDNESFQDFVEYVQRVSPEAVETLGALVVAIADIVEAAAPIGELTLPVIKAVAQALSAIAESPAGPALIAAAAGLSAISRAVAVYNVANGAAITGMLGKFATAKIAAAGVGALALSLTDLDDQLGVSNTAMGATIGILGGPWGVAVGGAIGAAFDFANRNDDVAKSLEAVDRAAADPTNLRAYASAVSAAVKDTQSALDATNADNFGDFTSPAEAWRGGIEQITGDLGEAADKAADSQREFQDLRQTLGELRSYTKGGGFDNLTFDVDKLGKFASRAEPALKKMGYSLEDLKDVKSESEFRRIAAGIRHFTREADSVPGRTDAVKNALKGLDNPMLNTADSAARLDAKLTNLFDPSLNAEQAMIDWRLGLMDLRKEIGKTSGSLSKFTREGLGNRQIVKDQIDLLKSSALARAEEGATAEEVARILRRGRKAIIDEGEAAGIARPKLRGHFDELVNIREATRGIIKQGNINTKVDTPGLAKSQKDVDLYDKTIDALNPFHDTKFDNPGIEAATNDVKNLDGWVRTVPDSKEVKTSAPGAKGATGEISGLDKAIREVDGKTVDVKLSTTATKIVSNVKDVFANLFADGGVVEAYANGGVRENHVAQIARPGAMRVWAEPETGGESYIPLAPAKRRRSIDIWQETGKRLGVDGFADGAVLVPTGGNNPLKPLGRIDKMWEQVAQQMGKGLSKYMNEQIESLNTGFNWPLPRQYGYTGSWGTYQSGGSHPALDFPAPLGTPIFSVLPGKVMYTRSMSGSYGNHTEISHGGGLTSLYAHQQRFGTKAGAKVAGGQTIGYVNSTGNSSGNHLHLEMQRNGGSFDFTRMLNNPGAIGLPGDYDLHGSGVSRYTPVATDALRALRGRKSALPSVMARMQQESGGDADIVNTTDSNWSAGTPSVGLMQVIGPTYQAYKPTPDRGPYLYGTSIDPFSNIYAGLNYARSRYGTIENGMTQPGGYRLGGMLYPGQLAFNETRTPERILDGRTTRIFEDMVAALGILARGNGGGGNGGSLQGFHTGGPRRFRAPDLERSAEREFRRAQAAIERADARLKRYEKAVGNAEKKLEDAKGEVEKQEAQNRLRNLEEKLDVAEKGQGKAERRLEEARANRQTAREDQKAIDRAFKRFDIKPGDDKSEVRSEVKELLSVVRQTMGRDSKLWKALDGFRDRLEKSAKRLDEERKEREKLSENLKALRQKSNQYASGIAGQFKNDPFSGGVDEFFLQANADKNDAKRFNRLRGRANRMGLDGPLARDLLASGNVELLAEFVRGGRDDIRRAEAAYESRNKFAGRAGDRSAANIYGDQIRKQNQALNRQEKVINRLEKRLEKLGDHVRDGAYDGTKDAQDGKKKKLQGFKMEARR